MNTEPTCTTCRKAYSPSCDYQQGRCPHHASMLDQILSDSYKSRFYNLLNFFKGNNMDIQPKDTSKGHFYVSLAKSAIRIIAGVCLMAGFVWSAGIGIVLAEMLGIVEELV